MKDYRRELDNYTKDNKVIQKRKMDEEEHSESKSQKTAIALSYDGDMTAPVIVATGKGYVAEKILKSAKEANVPVHKDEKLAKTLAKLELGDAIPPELYKVVAEILIYVNDMDTLKDKVNGKQEKNR